MQTKTLLGDFGEPPTSRKAVGQATMILTRKTNFREALDTLLSSLVRNSLLNRK
jgi:hypothetical protein